MLSVYLTALFSFTGENLVFFLCIYHGGLCVTAPLARSLGAGFFICPLIYDGYISVSFMKYIIIYKYMCLELLVDWRFIVSGFREGE